MNGVMSPARETREVSRMISRSPEETFRFGRELAGLLLPVDCVAISGELGTGKTRLVQGICSHFHCQEQVTSPTFTIINEYHGDRTVYHCDLYRLGSTREMIEAGLAALLDETAVLLVEWAEKAVPLLPLPRWEILLWHCDQEETREIVRYRCADPSNTLLTTMDSKRVI